VSAYEGEDDVLVAPGTRFLRRPHVRPIVAPPAAPPTASPPPSSTRPSPQEPPSSPGDAQPSQSTPPTATQSPSNAAAVLNARQPQPATPLPVAPDDVLVPPGVRAQHRPGIAYIAATPSVNVLPNGTLNPTQPTPAGGGGPPTSGELPPAGKGLDGGPVTVLRKVDLGVHGDAARSLASHGHEAEKPVPRLGHSGWYSTGHEILTCPTIAYCLRTKVDYAVEANFHGVSASLDSDALRVKAGRMSVTDTGILSASLRDPVTALILDTNVPVFGPLLHRKSKTATVEGPSVSVSRGGTIVAVGSTAVDIDVSAELGVHDLPKITVVLSTTVQIPSFGTVKYGIRTTSQLEPNPRGLIVVGAAVGTRVVLARIADTAVQDSIGGWLVGGREPGW
jgi:hypothetical protein